MSMTMRNRQINVNRQELIDALKKNLTDHAAAYQEAVLDYHAQMKRLASGFAADLEAMDDRRGDHVDLAKSLAKLRFQFPAAPVSHEKEYERAIKMLEFSQDETILIDEELFNAYVLNEWAWTAQFFASNATYKV